MATNDNTQGKRQDARRRLLRTLVAGGGAMAGSRLLPDDWRKPVVDKVLLPAHAQGTLLPGGAFAGAAELLLLGDNSGPAPGSLLDLVVGTAHAGNQVGNVTPVIVSYNIGETTGVVCVSDAQTNDSTGPLPLTRSGNDLSDVDYEPAGILLREQRVTPSGVSFAIGTLNSVSLETYTAPPGAFVCPQEDN